jgi:predicted NAD-dependent protein-ADP-ribosyltransferase YbiA (DUF1768 family)
MQHEIRFYKSSDPYYELSNFAPSKFTVDGQEYINVEVYYQCQKFIHHHEYMAIIANADSPMKSKLLATQNKNYRFASNWVVNKQTDKRLIVDIIDEYLDKGVKIRSDWDTARTTVMETALRAKFTQNPHLKQLLLSTGDATLIEDSPTDYFWGIGACGNGKNMLGQLLMKLRQNDM